MKEENTHWYPAFCLRENPFAINDYATERERYGYGSLNYVETRAVRKILDYAKAGASRIFRGLKGIGKSTAVKLSGEKLIKEEKGVVVVFAPAPVSVTDIYNRIWNATVDFIFYEPPTNEESEFLPDYLEEFRLGENRTCKRCDRKCVLEPPLLNSLSKIKHHCSLKRDIVRALLEKNSIMKTKQTIFILDAPDQIVGKKDKKSEGIRYFFEELVSTLKKTSTIILTVTPEQCKALQESPVFGRFKVEDFPLPSEQELKVIYEERVKSFQDEEFKSVFSEEALSYLINVSGRIPRKFVDIACGVLIKMKAEKLTEPASLSFVQNAIDPPTDEKEGVKRGIVEFLVGGATWVTNKELLNWCKNHGITMDAKHLGNLLNTPELSMFIFGKKKTPQTAYKIRL